MDALTRTTVIYNNRAKPNEIEARILLGDAVQITFKGFQTERNGHQTRDLTTDTAIKVDPKTRKATGWAVDNQHGCKVSIKLDEGLLDKDQKIDYYSCASISMVTFLAYAWFEHDKNFEETIACFSINPEDEFLKLNNFNKFFSTFMGWNGLCYVYSCDDFLKYDTVDDFCNHIKDSLIERMHKDVQTLNTARQEYIAIKDDLER